MSIDRFNEKVSFIWSVADLLRGPYKPAQYGEVMLPMTILRRFDCVLEPTKNKVLKRRESLKGGPVKELEQILNRAAGQQFHNTSKFDFQRNPGAADSVIGIATATVGDLVPSEYLNDSSQRPNHNDILR